MVPAIFKHLFFKNTIVQNPSEDVHNHLVSTTCDLLGMTPAKRGMAFLVSKPTCVPCPVSPDRTQPIQHHLITQTYLHLSTEMWSLWSLSTTEPISLIVLTTFYDFVCLVFSLWSVSPSLLYIHGLRRGYEQSCSVWLQDLLVAMADMSVLPPGNHTGIVTRMFLFPHHSLLKRMGILSYAFFSSWCLKLDGDVLLKWDERWRPWKGAFLMTWDKVLTFVYLHLIPAPPQILTRPLCCPVWRKWWTLEMSVSWAWKDRREAEEKTQSMAASS